MRRHQLPLIAVLLALFSSVPALSQGAPAETFRISVRERESGRWSTGANTQVENARVAPSQAGSLPEVKVDNAGGATPDGGFLFMCTGPRGTFQVAFDYRTLGAPATLRTAGLELTCLPPLGQIRLPVHQQRLIDLGDNTEVTKAEVVPAGGGNTARPENRGRRGGLLFACEGPFEGSIRYQYRIPDLPPPTMTGVVLAVCYEF